ncbi:MAG: c-type cytochrome [Ekhidna sp.]
MKKSFRSFILKTPLFLLLVIISSCSLDQDQSSIDNYPLLGAGFGINSSTMIVEDLKSARDYYADTLGFALDDADEFEKGLIEGSITTTFGFPDMSSIAFIAINDTLEASNTPSFISNFLKRGEGVSNYSLSSSSVDTTYTWLTDRGFKMDSIQSYRTSSEAPQGWSWDNGEVEEISVDFTSKKVRTYLPQFIEDTDADYQAMIKQQKTYYGYYRSYSNHTNGVIGIQSLQIVVDSMDVALEQFKQMGLTKLENDPSESGTRFQLKKRQELLISTPKSSDDAYANFLAERGSAVFAIRFEVANLDSTYQFLSQRLPQEAIAIDSLKERVTVLREYAYGVQLEFINEPEDQAIMASKYRIGSVLDSAAAKNAAMMYQKYCALCHGENREGYAADFAPSLRSKSLLATSKSTNFMRYTIQYGRAETAMAGYLDRQGGPMEYIEIELLLQWLYDTAGVEERIELSREPVLGDVALGATIYDENCAVCHGANGEGVSAPALGNPMLLATATDEFLKYAIKEGRDGTPMVAFKETLSEEEIDGVTAFLRSRAAGWDIPEGDTVTIPTPEHYVLNPNSKAPNFELKKELYVSAEQVYKAMQDSARMILLDARSEVAWRQTHIPGSIPVPYYDEPEDFVNDIPNDSTWIVAYCACPHAASGRVVSTLRRYGYKNTAILDEGVLVWAQMGYPVKNGQ